jgi:hypothetical protein
MAEDGVNNLRRVLNEWPQPPPRPRVEEAPAADVQAAVVHEYPQIQDLDDWLRTNGLPAQSNSSSTTLDRVEERERFLEFERYQTAMHESIFAQEMQQEVLQQQEREKQLRKWQDCKINLLAAHGKVVMNVPLQPMAAACETIFTMASCRRHFQLQQSTGGGTDTTTGCNDSSSDYKEDGKEKNLLFSLDDFTESSIHDFVSVVLDEANVENLTPDAIVDCCQIAHYVQNTSVFDATVEILLASIDTSNCLSLCYLADKLNIPLLFERSVGHLMHSVGSLENGSCWQDFTVELRNRILAIKQAIQSSIHDQRRTLYFSSLDEYIAIFTERCQYYRERLAEAKEQQQQCTDTSSLKYTQYVHDKIDRQERRVTTLEIALAEQKKLFASAQQTSY